MAIQHMGRVTAIGMRAKVDDPRALVINTCSGNGSADRGDPTHWTWSNPTNTAIVHHYHDVWAVSVECLWQGTKLRAGQAAPDPLILLGAWKANKGKRPVGAYAGPGVPPLTTPGEARRAIYLPAFRRLVDHWLNTDDQVLEWVEAALRHPGRVYLRDHDTGRGLDSDGPMSHAWVLAHYLNHNRWPE